jgi:hypothetical protein
VVAAAVGVAPELAEAAGEVVAVEVVAVAVAVAVGVAPELAEAAGEARAPELEEAEVEAQAPGEAAVSRRAGSPV